MSNKLLGIDDDNFDAYRTNKRLINAVEKLGSKASSGQVAILKVIEIPDDVKWELDEYDGFEHVSEIHRSWR